LETYEKESKPLLDHYGDDMIVNVDATKPPVVVLNTILSYMVSGQESDFLVES
jgi:adenylate kinase family enzyme